MVCGQSGAGMIAGWGNAPALIEPRGEYMSAAARRLFALLRNLRLLEECHDGSAWVQAEIWDAETRLRDHAVFLIDYQAA